MKPFSDSRNAANAEASMSDKTRFVESLINLLPDVVYIYDIIEQKNIYSNDRIQEILGYSAEEIRTMGSRMIAHLMHPDDFATYMEKTLRSYSCAKDNEQITHEYRMRHRNGNWHWIESRELVHERLEDGSPKQIFGVLRDITERKRAEEAIRLSEENFRFQFLNMNSYNSLYEVVADEDGRPYDFRFIMVNHAYEEYVGKKASELVGRTLLEVYPKTEQYWIDKMTEAALSDIPIHFESFSQVMNTHTEINLYVPKKGQLAMTTANITERKLAEERLLESERHLKKSQQIAHLGSWRLDLATNQVVWTEELYNMYGFDPSLPPPPYTEHGKLFTPASWETLSASLANTRETGNPYELELETIKRDGSNGWMWVRGEAIKGPDGNTIGLWGAAQDITERKRLENKLQKAQKLESLGVLAGGIAHDFNNLMGGIFGYLEMAKVHSSEEMVTERLSKAMDTIERAKGLTAQLLTFATGGAPIRKVDHLFPFVEETARFSLSGSNVSCRFDVPDDLWTCSFDRNQIGQVIDNLVINAQQAMPVGGTIEVTAGNRAFAEEEHTGLAKGNYIEIAVQDRGIGIQKELIAKIFDPFFTTKTKGHGLGLATSYSIINRHGGCIEVESEPGKGSTFHIYLPSTKDAAVSPTGTPAAVHKGKGTFLIMDDEQIMRETIRDMLKSLGYRVVSKENGNDAVAFFASESAEKQDVTGMIFDLTIPGGMGGRAAVEEIRKLNTEIPVFVASGYADDPVMKNPKEYGFTASICKPFRRAELVDMLESYLNRLE